MDWRAAACGGRNHLKARRKRRLYNNPIPAGLRRFSGTPELSIPQDPLDRTTGYYHGITVPTLTLKVTKEFKARLTRAARKRKLPVSEVVRAAVEKELPAGGKGWLLGACAHHSAGPSTYDPAKPVFDEDEWEMLKK